MAMSKRELDGAMKVEYLEQVRAMLAAAGEEVLRVGSNEIAFPIVDAAGNEKWMVVTFKVPTGSRDGDEYDGYSMAHDYEMKLRKKQEQAQEKARKAEANKAKRMKEEQGEA